MTSYLKNISNETNNKKNVDDLTLNKLTTRKVNRLRQRENRARIIEKTRNILDPNKYQQQTQQSENSNENCEQTTKQVEHCMQQEISKFKRRSIKLNETKRQNETEKLVDKINNFKSKLIPFNRAKVIQNNNIASQNSSIQSSSSSLNQNTSQRKPLFRISKIIYDDKHLYQQVSINDRNDSKCKVEVFYILLASQTCLLFSKFFYSLSLR